MTWQELCITVPHQDTDTAAAIANMVVSRGIAIEDYSDLSDSVAGSENTKRELIDEQLQKMDVTTTKIRIYIDATSSWEDAAAFLEERLTACGIEYTLQNRVVDEESWQDNWKAYFHPVKIGKKIVVCPSWEAYTPEPDELVITLDPGMAFGTGTHRTTRLCIEELEKAVRPGDRVLDIGCGSGILSIGALKLGAKGAVGLDIDGVAVKIARENVTLCGYSCDTIRIVQANILDDGFDTGILNPPFGVVIVNIVADVVIACIEKATGLLRSGGVLIASGIIASRASEVETAADAAGLKIHSLRVKEDWAVLTATT